MKNTTNLCNKYNTAIINNKKTVINKTLKKNRPLNEFLIKNNLTTFFELTNTSQSQILFYKNKPKFKNISLKSKSNGCKYNIK
jgi:hypothetical protein